MEFALLTLTEEEQFMIFSKMENIDLIRLSSTCSYVKKFVKNHERALSSRIAYGDQLSFNAENGVISVEFNETRGIKLDSQFRNKIGGLSFSQFVMDIKDLSLTPRLLEIVKDWNPMCTNASIWGKITPDVIEIMNNIRCSQFFQLIFQRNDNKSIFNKLKQARNPEKIIIHSYVENSELYTTFNQFYGFNIDTTADNLFQFFWDLHEAQYKANFQCITFQVTDIIEKGDQSLLDILPGRFFPSAIELASVVDNDLRPIHRREFRRRNRREIDEMEKIPNASVFLLKIKLPNEKCILIADKNQFLRKTVEVTVRDDDDREILEYILDKLKISNYPNNKKEDYLAMNDRERAYEMKISYILTRSERKRRWNRYGQAEEEVEAEVEEEQDGEEEEEEGNDNFVLFRGGPHAKRRP